MHACIVAKGVIAPKLTEENINDMPFRVFIFLRNAICQFSGYTIRGVNTKPEFRCEYLEENEENQKLLGRCKEIVYKHRLTQFMKRMIVSGNFSKSLARWQTYDVANDTFGWDDLDLEERNDLIEKNKLAETTVGASSLNYDPKTGFFSTIIINTKNYSEESLEFIILHELQHNLNALSNFDFIANLDEKILKKRIQEYKKEHNIEKTISGYLAIEMVVLLNEVFVEREMQRHPYFIKYCEKKVDLLLKFAKSYQKTKSEEKERIKSIGLAFYIIKWLTVISSFLEGENQLYLKVKECLSCFSSPYANACREAIKFVSKVHIDIVSFDQIFTIIEIFEIFNTSFVSFQAKKES